MRLRNERVIAVGETSGGTSCTTYYVRSGYLLRYSRTIEMVLHEVFSIGHSLGCKHSCVNCVISSHHLNGYILNSLNDQLPVGLMAQLVERCTGIAEVMGSNPVQA